MPQIPLYFLAWGALLLELAGPKELVLVGVNGKVKAGSRDNPRDPCVEYTQELIIYNIADLATKISDIPPTFLRDFLLLEGQDTLCLNDLGEKFLFFSVNFIFFSTQISKNYAPLRTHSSPRPPSVPIASGAISGRHPQHLS